MGNISYTAVVLDSGSREKLRKEFNNWSGAIPQGWEWIAHHMTIKLGALPEPLRSELLGREATLKITKLGMSDMALAIGVTGFYSERPIPHVTLAVNTANGGKPYMSNNIAEWSPYSVDFTLTGVVEEIEQPEQTQKNDERNS